MAKIFKHFYITSGLRGGIDEVLEDTGWSATLFFKKAIDLLLSQPDPKIDKKFLITKRKDPDYMKRDLLYHAYIEEDQMEKILEIAEKYNCKYSVVIFQALYDYCLLLQTT